MVRMVKPVIIGLLPSEWQWEASAMIADFLSENGKNDEALTVAETPFVRVNRGVDFLLKGEEELAEKEFKRALELEPFWFGAYEKRKIALTLKETTNRKHFAKMTQKDMEQQLDQIVNFYRRSLVYCK